MWTAEKVSQLTSDQVKTLRANAMGRDDAIVALCDEILGARKPKKSKVAGVTHSADAVPLGFHFKCVRGQGTFRNDRGLWTGTWVVKRELAEKAARAGSYVALHETKAEPSYLQGKIIDCQVSKRERQYAEGQVAKTPFGIDFLIEPTHQPYDWVGDGAGERGYAWPTELDKS